MGKNKKKNRAPYNIARGHSNQIQKTKGDVKINQSRHGHNKSIQQNGEIINNYYSGFQPPGITPPTAILVFFAIILVITATIIFINANNTKNAQTPEDTSNIETEDTQMFSATSQNTERAGIPYMEYTLTSEPSIGGFHIRPYPYISYKEDGSDTFIPILNLFTQEEYTANTSGQCTLLQESLSSSFTDPNNPNRSFTLEQMHCLVAILYIKDAEPVRVLYELRDGELTYADKEIAIQVLQLFEDIDSSTTLDIRSLPVSDSK